MADSNTSAVIRRHEKWFLSMVANVAAARRHRLMYNICVLNTLSRFLLCRLIIDYHYIVASRTPTNSKQIYNFSVPGRGLIISLSPNQGKSNLTAKLNALHVFEVTYHVGY